MSGLTSTSPAAHAYLVANIATATGIQTFNRSALGTDLEERLIVVGGITNLVQNWAGLGNDRRDETYKIGCMVRVFTGDNPTTADVDTLAAACWAYVEDVVQLLITDFTLGGNVIFAELASASELPPAAPNGGVEIAVEFEIACRAQVLK